MQIFACKTIFENNAYMACFFINSAIAGRVDFRHNSGIIKIEIFIITTIFFVLRYANTCIISCTIHTCSICFTFPAFFYAIPVLLTFIPTFFIVVVTENSSILPFKGITILLKAEIHNSASASLIKTFPFILISPTGVR